MSVDKNVLQAFSADSSFGFTMRGWNFKPDQILDAIKNHRMLNPAFELGSNICPWNCDFCFTESPGNIKGLKVRLAKEMPLKRRLRLIEESADLGAQSINFVGAGEPTIDPDFWSLIEKIKECRIVPIVYSEGTLKLRDRGFASRLFDLGATVVLKVNSLSNAEYQDRVVKGLRAKDGVPTDSYFEKRKEALKNLIDIGFNKESPTRLAFDTIICRENLDEIPDIHRFARANNIFVLFVNFLPSGRSTEGHTTAIDWTKQHEVFQNLAKIDKEVFHLEHSTFFPYAGGVPCTIRGLGIFVKICGEVWDCPGESLPMGNMNSESLKDVWEKTRPITSAFDGMCFPRKKFWLSKGMAIPEPGTSPNSLPNLG